MLSEVDIGGIYVAPIVVYAAAALPVALIIRAALWRIGLLRQLWHPALFVFAVYVSTLALMVMFV